MTTVALTQESFIPTIEKEGIVFVDWWAPWCGPCRAFGPIYDAVAKEHPEITWGKVNTQDEQMLGAQAGVRSIPTLMVFVDGILVFSEAGMLPKSALKQLVEKVKELDMNEVRAQLAEQQQQAANG